MWWELLLIILLVLTVVSCSYISYRLNIKTNHVRQDVSTTNHDMKDKIRVYGEASAERDKNTANMIQQLMVVMNTIRSRVTATENINTNLRRALEKIQMDFENIPRVRETLPELQPIDTAIYTDHFTINEDGHFVFVKSQSPVLTLQEGFVGALNTQETVELCTDTANENDALCKFCSTPDLASGDGSICTDASVPYYYWINHAPVSSKLHSDFTNQCLDVDESDPTTPRVNLKESCEIIRDPSAKRRIVTMFHLVKMAVDSMDSDQLTSLFATDPSDNIAKYDVNLNITSNNPVEIIDTDANKTYTFGNLDGMPFSKQLLIVAIKLKSTGNSFPPLYITGTVPTLPKPPSRPPVQIL